MHQFPKFTPTWNSTYFGQFLCPWSGVYSLYTWHWYRSYRFVDSFRAGPGWNVVVLLESCLQNCKTYTIAECTVNKLLMMQQDHDGTQVPSCSCSKAVYKPVWHIPLLSVQLISSWWCSKTMMELKEHHVLARKLSTNLYDIYHCCV
jgi:hypothetical protein